jgi:tetratricopeptide (TPR) repeat protein
MAFGFGFNKQKALSSAEKYVQQGKIQNAISEYEKVLKNDPKDLTVTNTVGDLYSRLGDPDKATECFKIVGDAYANQGFTVKAIAMYKKISKLKPSLESVLKLAELYTQQGLFNDARAQYLQVAEEFLKSGELDNAVRIFQKILEMDPENTNMRIRLAEVYVRLNKKNDAWEIFSAVAETLRSKGSLSAAEDVLKRMLTLDPGNSYALLMQGRNLLEAGDAEAAIQSLQKVSDIDSNPEGLRDLFKAYLKTGRLSDAGTLAGKLLAVHNDLATISNFADALMKAGQYENALQVYGQHAERLLAENQAKVLENLHSIIGYVRDNPASLEKLLQLFQKAGETTHVTEVLELLAHASVQSGDLPRARDLYRKLATVEPGNPLHMGNYQQVVSQIGGTSAARLISAEEAAVIVDELEAAAPSIHQHYSDVVALAVRSALTDAELFISYNMPAKALGPLMAALPQAPNDLRVNQRLAALHTRASRFAEAGVCCRTLQTIYSDAGYPDEATRYGELAERYEERAAASESVSAVVAEPALPAELGAEEISVETAAWPSAEVEGTEFTVVEDQETAVDNPEAVAEADGTPAEIDLSSEWDDSVTVELDAAPAEAGAIEIGDADQPVAAESDIKDDPERAAEAIEELRFYLEHGMPEQAASVFEKLQSLTSDQATLEALRSELAAASEHVHAVDESATVEAVSEFVTDQLPAEFAVDEAPAAIDENAAAIEEFSAQAASTVEETVEQTPDVEHIHPTLAEDAFVEPVAEQAVAEPALEEVSVEQPVAETPAPQAPGVLQEFTADLESALGEGFLPATDSHEAAQAIEPAEAVDHVAAPELEPVGAATPTSFGIPQIEVMGEIVAELEASVGEDFLKDAPVAQTEPVPEAVMESEVAPDEISPAPVAAQSYPAPLNVSEAGAPLSVSAAAASSGGASVSLQSQTPVPQQSVAGTARALLPPVINSALAPGKTSPFAEDAGVDLAEMFGELKSDLEAGVATTDEDPETHYNLGIAFREMGLLDEAIGELQKTCQAVDRGHPFPQVMQTYTWLAQCFLDKGVPEAAIRWYLKALAVPTIDEETRTALHYELAAAYETSGDKPSGLKHFMEVYGRNIDYRDVAERIKALRS